MLTIDNIHKTFFPGSVNEKRALQGVSLTLQDGDFATVIGSNGAGKSTLLNAIAGAFYIDQGQIRIDDIDVTRMPEHERAQYIGRVFQDPMKGTASKMMGLGLEDRMSAHVGLLSGGQRQALTLLMATLVKPRLLLLDEHTAALDPKTAEKVLQLTERLVKADHLTTLMITHNMRDALRFGNRLIMMHQGRIVVDVKEEEKSKLTVPDLLALFEKGAGVVTDEMLLS